MASQGQGEDAQPSAESQQATASSAFGWTKMIEEQYAKIKENAETYPYVWGSYIIVYGGFSLWMGYRWRKLRKTEDRVRGLQERLRKLVEAENSANTAATEKASSDANKPMK